MRKYFAIVLLVIMASCAAKKQAAEFEALPDWVKQKPIIPGYYVGIGSVNKIGTSAQYTSKARQEALTDLAESVSSNVSSRSVLHSIETEFGSAESFDQRIQISTDDYLEGFEPVDSYENESAYWVYYKIDKNTYHEMKEKKKKEATATALAKYESGLLEENTNKPKEALSFYLQGLQAIKRYLSEETSVNYKGNTIDIGNELYSSVSEIINSLSIEAETSKIRAKRGNSFDEPLNFWVKYNKTPAQGIPVEFSYTGGYLKKDHQSSTMNGLVQIEPEVLYSRNGKETITAVIDLKELAQKSVDDLFIRGLILKKKLKPASVEIIIESPSVALNITDKSCLNTDECEKISNLFTQNAKQFGYELKSVQEADFIVVLSFSAKKGESAGGLVSQYISGKMDIRDNTGSILWSKQTEDIKGVGYNLEDAYNSAMNEFQNALNRKYFKQGFDGIK